MSMKIRTPPQLLERVKPKPRSRGTRATTPSNQSASSATRRPSLSQVLPHPRFSTATTGRNSQPATPREPTKADKVAVRSEYAALGKLYVLAVFLMDFDTMNQLINAMGCAAHAVRVNHKTWFPERETINIIYEGTNVGDHVRELLALLVADFAEGHWFPDNGYSQFHAEYIYDCLKKTLATHPYQAADRAKSKTYDTVMNFCYKLEEDGTYARIDEAVYIPRGRASLAVEQ